MYVQYEGLERPIGSCKADWCKCSSIKRRRYFWIMINAIPQIRFLGDYSGEFSKALDLNFDAPSVFGDARSKRYVLKIVDGKVAETHVEPDNTGYTSKI